eukprot:766965-Hanusia_phi.AAC.5
MVTLNRAVASLQDQHDPPSGQLHAGLRHLVVAGGRDLTSSQRIALRGIEPCTNEHQVRAEFSSYREEKLIEHSKVLGVSCSRLRPRHVDREAPPLAGAAGREAAVGASRVERASIMAMDREEEDRAVGQEHLLCPVAVVDIPVEDQDPLCPLPQLRLPCGHCHIAEDAEAHGARRKRVVSRGSDRTERSSESIAGDHLRGLHDRASCQHRALPGLGAQEDRVHVGCNVVELLLILRQRADGLHVPSCVHRGQLLGPCQTRPHQLHPLQQPVLRQLSVDVGEAEGLLGVEAERRLMQLHPPVVHEPDAASRQSLMHRRVRADEVLRLNAAPLVDLLAVSC